MIIQGQRDFLVEKAVSFLAMAIRLLASSRQRVVFGTADGEGVMEILARLAATPLPWESVDLFLLEESLGERGISPVLAEIRRALGECGNLCRIHAFCLGEEPPDTAANRYGAELLQCGGHFDLILASCGSDGRIASLYPNHPALENRQQAFLVIHDAPEPPTIRMTAASELFRLADTGILLAFGKDRRASLARMFDPYLSEVECPARLFTRLKRHYLLTDQEIDFL